MTTDTLDKEALEIRASRIKGLRDVSTTSVIGVRSPAGSTETSYAVFVPLLSTGGASLWPVEAPPVELEEQRFRCLQDCERFLRNLEAEINSSIYEVIYKKPRRTFANLEGIWKGKVDFSYEEIEEAKIKFI